MGTTREEEVHDGVRKKSKKRKNKESTTSHEEIGDGKVYKKRNRDLFLNTIASEVDGDSNSDSGAGKSPKKGNVMMDSKIDGKDGGNDNRKKKKKEFKMVDGQAVEDQDNDGVVEADSGEEEQPLEEGKRKKKEKKGKGDDLKRRDANFINEINSRGVLEVMADSEVIDKVDASEDKNNKKKRKRKEDDVSGSPLDKEVSKQSHVYTVSNGEDGNGRDEIEKTEDHKGKKKSKEKKKKRKEDNVSSSPLEKELSKENHAHSFGDGENGKGRCEKERSVDKKEKKKNKEKKKKRKEDDVAGSPLEKERTNESHALAISCEDGKGRGDKRKKEKSFSATGDNDANFSVTNEKNKSVDGDGNRDEKKRKKKKKKDLDAGSMAKEIVSTGDTNSPNDVAEPSDPSTSHKKTKKVTFSNQNEYFSVPDSSSKKKKKKLDDDDDEGNRTSDDGLIRGKRFTKEEDEIVEKAVLEYIEERQLGENGLEMILKCKSYPEVKDCWKEIGKAIPYRPYMSVYYRAHILFERGEVRKWTQEELDLVKKYYEKHGANWKALADEMGKHRFHVKDAWRRIRLPNMKKGDWSQDEYQTLFNLVNLDLSMKAFQEKKSKHGMLRDNISWEAISEKLATRSNAVCCQKWYYQLTSPLVVEGKWADTDDYRLLMALTELDAACEEDVDWDNLLEHRSGDICRERWNQMVRHIGHHGIKPFIEQVEILSQRYCPDILEAREEFESKSCVD